MGFRRFLNDIATVAVLVVVFATIAIGADAPISWLDAGHLKPDRPPRPKPIEVDKPHDGPLRSPSEFDPPADWPEPAPQPAPRVYELTDAGGTRWTGTDWPALWGWVQGRNAAMRPPAAYQTRAYRGTTLCPTGTCPQP